MPEDQTIVFVCEHGAAKSVLAAAYFDKLAAEMGLPIRAMARGTHPDSQLSPQVVQGLSEDGLTPKESLPRKLSSADVKTASRIVAFCELPIEYKQEVAIEQWDGVPPVGDNYEQARQVIRERIEALLERMNPKP